MSSSYSVNLLNEVINNSESNSWESAVLEWEIAGVKEDENNSSSCICGKEHIRYLFTIKNVQNGNDLFTIGSSCINKFNGDDLNEITSINEVLFKLLNAVKKNELIYFNSDYFSRKLLNYIFDNVFFKHN